MTEANSDKGFYYEFCLNRYAHNGTILRTDKVEVRSHEELKSYIESESTDPSDLAYVNFSCKHLIYYYQMIIDTGEDLWRRICTLIANRSDISENGRAQTVKERAKAYLPEARTDPDFQREETNYISLILRANALFEFAYDVFTEDVKRAYTCAALDLRVDHEVGCSAHEYVLLCVGSLLYSRLNVRVWPSADHRGDVLALLEDNWVEKLLECKGGSVNHLAKGTAQRLYKEHLWAVRARKQQTPQPVAAAPDATPVTDNQPRLVLNETDMTATVDGTPLARPLKWWEHMILSALCEARDNGRKGLTGPELNRECRRRSGRGTQLRKMCNDYYIGEQLRQVVVLPGSGRRLYKVL